jgi:hypothetical protein
VPHTAKLIILIPDSLVKFCDAISLLQEGSIYSGRLELDAVGYSIPAGCSLLLILAPGQFLKVIATISSAFNQYRSRPDVKGLCIGSFDAFIVASYNVQ